VLELLSKCSAGSMHYNGSLVRRNLHSESSGNHIVKIYVQCMKYEVNTSIIKTHPHPLFGEGRPII